MAADQERRCGAPFFWFVFLGAQENEQPTAPSDGARLMSEKLRNKNLLLNIPTFLRMLECRNPSTLFPSTVLRTGRVILAFLMEILRYAEDYFILLIYIKLL
jgi:hypothetical protein